MKIYLGFPRVGQTLRVGEVQFIDGEAEIQGKNIYLERYYNAVYVDPRPNLEQSNGLHEEIKEKEEVVEGSQNGNDSTQIENDSPPQVEDDDSTLLSQIVEQKKRELENKVELTPLEKFDSLKTWGEKRSYVRSITGILPKDKAQAMELLGVK